MKTASEFRSVYADGTILGTKLDFHARYSSVATDVPATVSALIGAPNEDWVLDIGCGTGHFVEHLSAAGHQGNLVGLDLVRPAIADTARKRYIAGDAADIAYPDDSFDAITCIHTLSHLPDIAAAMREVQRVMKQGGVYVATANSIGSYPHVAEYRRRIHTKFGWGEPEFTTTFVNAENLESVLSPHWQQVEVHRLVGELRIPWDEFSDYFAANIPTWTRTPSPEQRAQLMRWVTSWARIDQADDGRLVEPKMVAVATCSN